MGRYVGHCWYCRHCSTYIINYVNGKHIIVYNEQDRTKHDGIFKHCTLCNSMWLLYDDYNNRSTGERGVMCFALEPIGGDGVERSSS